MPKRRNLNGAERYFVRRAGRKSNPNAKRRQTTAEGQGRNSPPPIEPMMRKLELVGICALPAGEGQQATVDHRRDIMRLLHAHGVATIAAEDVLGVLYAAGKLAHGDEDPERGWDRHQAGARYAWVHWYLLGRPFARAADMGVTTPPAPPAKLPPELAELSREDLARYYAMWLRAFESGLSRVGRHAQAVVRRCVVHCEMPAPGHLAALRRGLNALAAVTAPRVADLPALHPAECA